MCFDDKYPFGPEWLRQQYVWCGQYQISNLTNRIIYATLFIGLIVITLLVYHKHKGEQGVWKKIIKRDLLFFLIVFILWIIRTFILWSLGPACSCDNINIYLEA